MQPWERLPSLLQGTPHSIICTDNSYQMQEVSWNKNCVLEEESQGYSKSGIQPQTIMKGMDFRGGEHTTLRTETRFSSITSV